MNKKKKQVKWMILGTMFLSVIGLVIAYIAMYTALNINEVNRFWSVNFDSLEEMIEGDASTKASVLNSTSLTVSKIDLFKKNDSVTYKFKVRNTGGVDARLIVVSDMFATCNGNGCSDVKYEFMYSNGQNVATGDILKADTNMELVLSIEYVGESETKISLSDLELLLIYEQV